MTIFLSYRGTLYSTQADKSIDINVRLVLSF
jgi:hypothetical protein